MQSSRKGWYNIFKSGSIKKGPKPLHAASGLASTGIFFHFFKVRVQTSSSFFPEDASAPAVTRRPPLRSACAAAVLAYRLPPFVRHVHQFILRLLDRVQIVPSSAFFTR